MTVSRIENRVIASLIIVLIFFAAAGIRTPDMFLTDEEVRSYQCDTDSVAATGHPFTLQSGPVSIHLLPSIKEANSLSSIFLNRYYRGPPGWF